jgi:hypothetical protein
MEFPLSAAAYEIGLCNKGEATMRPSKMTEVTMFSARSGISSMQAFLFSLIFCVLFPWSVSGGPTPLALSPANAILANGSSNNIYLPLTIKCADCQSLIGHWIIKTPDETHQATFYPNGTFSMLLQGDTTAYPGNYSCTGNQFEGLIITGTVSLKFKGTLTCSGTESNGTWEISNSGDLLDAGNFSGQKL